MENKIRKIMMINRNERAEELFRFLFVGSICFFIDYFLLYLFTVYCNISYLFSSALSFSISLVANYIFCVKWVFKQVKNQNARQYTLFIASSIVGLGINQLCMWAFVEIAFIHYMVAKIIASAIVFAWNYFFKRKVVQM